MGRKFILMSVGTRGDMEPFLAIGRGLRTRGHRVICSFPEQFGYLAEEAGLGFASLGSGFIELLDSDLGQAAMGGGGSVISKFTANVRRSPMRAILDVLLRNRIPAILNTASGGLQRTLKNRCTRRFSIDVPSCQERPQAARYRSEGRLQRAA